MNQEEMHEGGCEEEPTGAAEVQVRDDAPANTSENSSDLCMSAQNNENIDEHDLAEGNRYEQFFEQSL